MNCKSSAGYLLLSFPKILHHFKYFKSPPKCQDTSKNRRLFITIEEIDTGRRHTSLKKNNIVKESSLLDPSAPIATSAFPNGC
jgi:hypothetical protein